MTMRFTNEEMSHDVEVMSSIKETGKLGYAIARNMRKMKDECQEYIQLKSDLFQKYGEIKGNLAMIKPENRDAFSAEMGDLPNEEHDVEIYTVPEDVFLNGKMDSQQMETLLWMVKE